ncbi:MAG: restriction endonuclease [Nitrososphaerota archaeon]|jgi:HJR/Mrr/RecB family endonuclease|nr:restriction endonuclease [Nitrososphaerota archaeon]
MHNIKFNGLIQEILENPNTNITELLQDKLHISLDKAEVLANRIEKQYLQQTIDNNTKQPPLKITTKKPPNTKQQKENLYNFESLSNKEFESFTKWLLQELGYNIHPEKIPTIQGVDYIATKNNVKTAILTRKYPTNSLVSDAAVLMAQQEKHNYQCEQAIILTTTMFSDQAKITAEKYDIELWDLQKLEEKIIEVKKKDELEVQAGFPKYKETLLDSLLALEQHTKFSIEKRTGEKYDLYFSGVKFPLLTFQTQKGIVIRLTYRIRYNEPVGENDGDTLIRCDRNGNHFGPKDTEAYAQITEYLEQFLE